MSAAERDSRPATSYEIREIIGPADDALVAGILRVEATCEEIAEAYAWLSSDDYLHRDQHHALSGRAAQVFEILEAELPEADQP